MRRVLQYDQVEVDSAKMTEYDHPVHGPTTVFHDVVLAREIIHRYDDGMAYKPAKELEAAYWTAEGMWAIAGGHPDTAIIVNRDQMQGKTVDVRYSKSLIDKKTGRPNNRGIVGDLHVYDNRVSPETLKALKNGEKRDVSIGFIFSQDDTPGKVEEDGHPLNGQAYDYVQRNIAINHTAFAIDAGRCPMPFCGIGADDLRQHIAADPFGKWESMSECIEDIMKENPDYTKEQAAATCATIEKRSKAKKDAFKTALENMKSEIEVALAQFVDEVKEDAGVPKTDPERAMAHFGISKEEWEKLSDEKKQEYIDKLPSRGEGLKEDEAQVNSDMSLAAVKEHFRLSDESWDKLLDTERAYLVSLFRDKHPDVIMDEGAEPEEEESTEDEECVECDDDYEELIVPHLAVDALTYAQKKALPDSAYAYIEPGCEKEDGKTQQSCRHMPIHDKAHVAAALQALGGARTGKVPSYASKAKPKICAAARKFGIESEVCGTKKKSKDASYLDKYIASREHTIKKDRESIAVIINPVR